MVVDEPDEPDDPDLRVLARRPLQPEGTLDVDVPQLVGSGALVGGATGASLRGPARPQVGEQAVDRVVVERVDAAPVELCGEALAVPVRQQAHNDDGPSDLA